MFVHSLDCFERGVRLSERPFMVASDSRGVKSSCETPGGHPFDGLILPSYVQIVEGIVEIPLFGWALLGT